MRIYRQLKILVLQITAIIILCEFTKERNNAMKKMTLMLLSAVLILSASLYAAPLNQTHIPAEAKWVIHLDVNMLTSSELWKAAGPYIIDENQNKIDWFTNLFGFDPTKDIYAATLYGTDAKEENAVFILYGQFNKEKLISLLEQNEDYAESEYQGQKLYHWFDEKDNKKKVGIFASESMIVISQSQQQVQEMIDLIAGRKIALQNQKDAPLTKLIETPENAIMVLAADGLSQLNKNKKDDVISKNAKTISAVAGEKDGKIYMYADLTAETQQAAMQIEQIVSGIKAFIELKHTNNPRLMQILQTAEIKRNENMVSFSFRCSSPEIFKAAFANIFNAAKTGDTEAIQQHLSEGTDINAKDLISGSTPLITASCYGQTETVRLLIEKQADLNIKNNDGVTALHVAAFFGYPEIVELLLEKGVDTTIRNNRGETALYTVAAPWSPELAGIYKWLGDLLKMEIDLEHIKTVRPKIAEMLHKIQ